MWEMTKIFNLFHNKISPSGWNWWKLLVESHVCVHKRINAARHANGVYSRYMYTWQNAWSDERRYLMKFLTILWTNFLLEGCENLEGPVSHQRNMCFKAFYVCLSTLNLRRAGLEKCPFILIQRADVDYYLPFLNEHRQWYGLRRIDSAVMRVQARVTTSSKLYDHLTRQTQLWLVSSCVEDTQETDTRVGLILALLSFLVVVLLPAERIGRRWKVSLFNRFSSVSHIAIVSGFELLNSIRRHAGDLDFLLILDTATSRACPAVLVKTDVVLSLRIALPSSAKTWNKFLFLWHLNTSIWSWCLQFCRIHWLQ